MKLSFSYHLTLFILKLKGLKKEFSKAPIDYKRIRKSDVHHPKNSFFKSNFVERITVSNTLITKINQEEKANKLLIFIPGGAFISGPGKHHWNSLKTIYQKTKHNIWMCDYPKAPEHKIDVISDNIDKIFSLALMKYSPQDITLLGDSAGGTLITALIQRLVKRNQKLPRKIILISPVMDSTMSNFQINLLERKDPMLAKKGVVSAKKMCAGKANLENPIISPINGSFDNFPETILFLGSNDITYPDQKLTALKLKKANIKHAVILGQNMPHIWPLLPVMKEAKAALNEVIKQINE